MKPLFRTGNSRKGMLHMDPRTKLFILLVGNVAVFLTPTLAFEILLAFAVMILGLLCGVYRFSLRMTAVYLLLVAFQIAAGLYLSGMLRVMLLSFAVFVRKIFPCAMLGGIMISTTRVNEFMTAMHRLHLPKSLVVPLAVMLRYFPMIGEEWQMIKDAMRMRDVSPTLWGMVRNPAQTVECLYVPMLMSASKIADELSAASVTRGIENPRPRTCLQEIRFGLPDALCGACFTALLVAVFIF